MAKRETLVNTSGITKSFYTKGGLMRTVDPGDEVTVGEEIATRLKKDGFISKPKEKAKKEVA